MPAEFCSWVMVTEFVCLFVFLSPPCKFRRSLRIMWKLVDAFSVQAGCYLVQAGSQKLIVEGEYKSTSALSSTQHNLNGGPNNVKPGQ